MCYRDMEFHRCQSAGECRIGIAIHENTVWFFPDQNFFDLFQHPTGHSPVGCAVDAEVVVRFGDIQLLEEDIRHIGVKVLAGMDDYFCEG